MRSTRPECLCLKKRWSWCLDSDAILFGAIGHPKYDNDPTAKVRPEQGLLQLRKALGLFANIRPVSTYPSLHHLSPLKKAAGTWTSWFTAS
jgi:isocitrate/isopropylmalate dehydrogenase